MQVSAVKRLCGLESKNTRRKKRLAEAYLDRHALARKVRNRHKHKLPAKFAALYRRQRDDLRPQQQTEEIGSA